MTWFKVDDRLHSHPKTMAAIELRPSAMGLWVVAGSWSADHLTDGVVTKRQVERLGFTDRDAKALVSAGLWEQESLAIYRFHDWSRFQPTKADVEYKRSDLHAKRSEAGRRGGMASAASRQAKREAKAKQVASGVASEAGKQKDSPDPTRPEPDPKRKRVASPNSETAARNYTTAIDVFSYERGAAKKGTYLEKPGDEELAEAAVLWAISELGRDWVKALRMSARAFVKLSGDWEKEAGYPFKAWAADPGKWYALAERRIESGKRNGGPAPHEAAEKPADPEVAREAVGKIMNELGRKQA